MGKNNGVMTLADLAGLDLESGKFDENKKNEAKKSREEEERRKEKDSWKRTIANQNRKSNYQGNKGNFSNSNRHEGFVNNGYVGAPYNFVPMWERVAKVDKDTELISHALVDEELLSGQIDYTITARTPVLIDNGDKAHPGFVKNHYGKYAIPGSSMCGLIRSNVQVLSQSSLADDIDDYILMFREVGGAKDTSMNKQIYDDTLGSNQVVIDKKRVSVLNNVEAGYIENTGDGYVIHPTELKKISDKLGKMNYYVLSERTIVNDYLDSKKNGKKFRYGFFLQNKESIMQYEFKPFKKEGRDYIGTQRRGSYKPYMHQISYELSGDRTVSAVGHPGEYSKSGWVVSSGFMNKKKAVYIIPKCDLSAAAISISEEDIRAYKIDYEKKKNQLPEQKYWDLPKLGEMKPVFFIVLERIYFGFTPRLRLFYKNSIHQGLGKEHKTTDFDYAKSLFGYSKEQDSYKARVSFSDAMVTGDPRSMGETSVILGGPKPTSYSDYLSMHDGKPDTYNSVDFRLRGMKQYWLHKDIVSGDQHKSKENKNDKVGSHLNPLPSGTVFKGKVRFHNLRKEELGLLIWALELNKESEMNIGKAKPYGYGRISLDIDSIRRFDPQLAYCSEALNLNPLGDIGQDAKKEIIQSFQKELCQKLGVSEIGQISAIQTFFRMKDASRMPAPDTIKYMDIDAKEYQNRRPLKPADEV